MKKFRKKLNEEGVAANATSSNVAGIGKGLSGEPPSKKGNILRRPMLDTLTENLINIIRKRKNK